MCKFRNLRADEIDVRVQSVKTGYDGKPTGVILLLYKDARCDMNILDETVGALNWQRHHSRENANCIVSIWDDKKQQWIEKEDTGTESNTEAAKGLCSDSFKRACTNFGIGRELYTSPFIWITADCCNIKEAKDRTGKTVYKCNDNFSVHSIDIQEKKIVAISIFNESTRNICFTYSKTQSKKQGQEDTPPPQPPKNAQEADKNAVAVIRREIVKDALNGTKLTDTDVQTWIVGKFKRDIALEDLTQEQFDTVVNAIKNSKNKTA